MKFKTRLRVTFISIILLPLLLTIMAFVMIAIYLMNYSQGLSLTDIDYSMMSENFREFTNTTDQAYYVLLDQVKEDSSRLEDKEYLDHINEEVSRKSTYIIVRKGDKLYYAGNEEAAQQIFEKLPAYGDENLSDDSGYFYNELEKYVKRIYRHEGQFADLETSADRYVRGDHCDPDLHQPDADPVDPQGRI